MIDPRIKALFGAMPEMPNPGGAASGEEILEQAAQAAKESAAAFQAMCDSQEAAPSASLHTQTLEFTSAPDGNAIKVQHIRIADDVPMPCVYYVHGGGMQSGSCFYGMYSALGRGIVDFRRGTTRLPQAPDRKRNRPEPPAGQFPQVTARVDGDDGTRFNRPWQPRIRPRRTPATRCGRGARSDRFP